MVRRIVALFALATLAACVPNLSDVTNVYTSYTLCINGCRAFSISFDRTGSYTIDADTGAPIRGRAQSLVDDAFKYLPLADLARCPRARTVASMDNLTIVVHLKGSRVLYCTETASGTDDPHSSADRLRTYARLQTSAFYSAVLRRRQSDLTDALREDAIRSVELRRTGCFGNCPAYRVRFRRSGPSDLLVIGPRCAVRSASVSFERVRAALWEGGATYLEPSYPRMWVDSSGASLAISTQKETIRSEGPDSMSWGPEFSGTVARLDQLVLDTPWNPPLPPRTFDFRTQHCR